MKKWLLGFVLVFATLFTNVVAEDNPRAVIIFDASGSMWGQINGVTKIEIARDALKNVVSEWNPSVELGLTAYGHRKKGDCSDIETVIPVGKVDKHRVVSTVMAIKPKGKTPISRSLRKVAEEIKYTEEKATIILISDGKETCDPDPCGTAKELEKDGIDFVTHVIGFNVDKKTDMQLECIADATGGEYFSAKNATALNEAMKVIVKKVEKVEPKPEPKPKVKKLDHTLEVTTSEKEGGKWVQGYNSIHQDENGKAGERVGTVHSYKKKAGTKQLPVGRYILKSTYNSFKKETAFEIKSGEVTKLHITMGETGTVEVTTSEKEGGKWVQGYNSIHQDENGKAGERVGTVHSYKKKAGTKQLPVGRYILKSTYNSFKKETAFEIKSGEVTKLHITMGETGTVEVTTSEKEGGKWVQGYNSIHQDENGKAGERVGTVHSYKKKAGTKQLPVGKYILKSTYNEFKKETAFEVKAGEVSKVNVVMGETGTVEVTASEKEGGKWVQAYNAIYKDEEGKAGDRLGTVHSYKKKAGTNQLPVGQYILKSTYNSFKKETAFEIKAGEVTKVNVLFGQFILSVKCTDLNAKINYEVYASSGRLVFDKATKCSDVLKITLDSGDYSVEAKVGSDIKTVKFTVGGDVSKLMLDMTDIKKEPTKEELIKADTQETPAVEEIKKETTNTVVAGQPQVQDSNTLETDVNEVKKSLAGLGALLGGAGGVQKSIESKPMQGIKESLIVALPYMEKTKECYGVANTLDDAKLCDVIANEGAKMAQAKMESVVGITGKMAKTIAHTEWSEAIRVKELAREEKDIENAKLYIVCIDKGVGMGQLKECADNNGEFEPKKTEVEQLGDMLKMFGGMK
ncbi:VWA domain-containing protein [Sulfurovum sp.]|uniref:vWA domain-containing protein n=1 Tax=Sulfurovum sp. TaxID=1969726 RepID=UPI0028681205|nr:VWA domain-containing protein [Sulfurovum sp.]